MKKLKSLGFGTAQILTRAQMKNVMGGNFPPVDEESTCNAYCGSGSGVTCSGKCSSCEDAGNGKGSKEGQDKMCFV